MPILKLNSVSINVSHEWLHTPGFSEIKHDPSFMSTFHRSRVGINYYSIFSYQIDGYNLELQILDMKGNESVKILFVVYSINKK